MIDLLFKQRRAVNLFFFVLFVLGLLALNKLGTAELPNPPSSGLSVTAILPGASPEEMDEKVARLLQNAIRDVPGIEDVRSQSRESMLQLRVNFVDNHKDEDALAREISQLLSQVQELPARLEGPYVSRPSIRVFPALTLVLEGGDDLQRHNAWYKIQQIIKNVEQVEFIETLGDRERRVEILIDEVELQRLSIRIDQVSDIIRQAITDQSAGRMETLLSMNRIRVKAQPHSLNDLREIPLQIGGQIYALEQLADVREVLAPETLRVNYGGRGAWYVNVYRRAGTKMSDLSEVVTRVIDHTNQQFEERQQDMRLTVIQDRNFIVDRVLGELGSAIIIGMLLVLIVLWGFFGFHNAVYVAIGIPFSFVATFIVMDLIDIDLNTFTLFGLVLVCGMIVDDSIVVLESICSKMEQGLEKALAIKLGLIEVLPAVLSSTATTVAAFMPLLLMTGGMGDFIAQIPKVAILALVASLVECFIVLPVHIYGRRSRENTIGQYKHNVLNRTMDRLADKMAVLTARLLNFPFRVLSGFIALLAITISLAYFTMDFELFDADEVRSVRYHLIFPKTTDLELTSRLLASKRTAMEAVPMVSDVVILNGWNDYNYARENRPHLATVEIHLEPDAYNSATEAERVAERVGEILAGLPGLERLLTELTKNKPPVSSPISIFLYGNDTQSLATANANVIAQLETIPSVTNITNPLEDGIPEMVFEVDEAMASHFGLKPEEIGTLLRFSITGEKIAKIDRGDEIVDIYVLAQRPDNWRANNIDHLLLTGGGAVPIAQLGTFTKKLAPDVVRRYQGNRYVAITADIDTSIMSNFKTQREVEKLITKDLLPQSVSFEQLGEFSSTRKSLTSMYQAALLSLGLIYLILAVLFRSYTQPLVVLLTVPLAYMGVVWGMAVLGRDLSLFGLVGVIGLIGIVVNDSLVWVCAYNRFKKETDKDLRRSRDAAVRAVRQRFRPIMLTTFTTVIGLLPVALSRSAGIAGSMASTIVSGLFVASLLLLFFLPVCVVIIDDLDARIQQWRNLRTAKNPI